MGKVLAEAGGDVQEAIDMSVYMAGEGRRLFGHTTPSELRDKFQMSVRMPVGVVGAITPWNFPIAIPAWKLAPALVCGNTVVLKPAEDTPLLAERFIELLAEAGPAGRGRQPRPRLRRGGRRPARRAIRTSRSSRSRARARPASLVTKAAADNLKHVHLELGGKNGIVVMDDADLDLAVEGIVWSAFGTSGQRCTAASRVIAHEAIYDELQKRLVARAEQMRIGPGWDPGDRPRPRDQPRGARQDPLLHRNRLRRGREAPHRRRGRDRGRARQGLLLPADDLRGRRAADADRAGGDLRPDDRADPRRATSTRRSASRTGSATASPPSIFTRDVNKAFRAMRDLQTGITYINAGTTGAEVHLPFGGTKDTGNGHREAGQAALDVFTEWKSIYVDYSGRLQRAQIDNVEQ